MAWIATAVVGGLVVGGAAVALSDDDDAPEAKTADYKETTRDALRAQVDLAPEFYKAEADQNYGRPAYARLQSQLVQDALIGEELSYDDQGRLITGYESNEDAYEILTSDELFDIYNEDAKAGIGAKITGGGLWGGVMVTGGEAMAKTAFNAHLQKDFGANSKYYIRDKDGNIKAGARTRDEINRLRDKQERVAIYKTDKKGDAIIDKSMAGKTIRTTGAAEILGGSQETTFADGTTRKAGYDEDGNFMGTSKLEQDILERAKRQQAESEISMVEDLGGRLTSAYRAQGGIQEALNDYNALSKYDSDHGGLRSSIVASAKEELALGGDLSAREQRRVTQDARIASAARGRIRGFSGIMEEVMANEGARRARLNERRMFASQALGLADAGLQQDRAFAAQRVGIEQATSADPFQAITGKASGAAVGSGQNLYGNAAAGINAGPSLYNPHAGAEFIANQTAAANNYNANIYAANQAKKGAILGGLFSAAGSVGAAAIGG